MMVSNSSRKPFTRTLSRIGILGTCIALLLGILSFLTGDASAAAAQPFIGTLGTSPVKAATEAASGVKVAMMELSWRKYEPQLGVFDLGYEREMQGRLASLRAAGMQVTLGLGLHFTPDWVTNQPNGRFVDQGGAVSSEADLVFNNNLRTYANQYLARANAALNFSSLWAIRVTSGARSEVLYPEGGHYWAFDVNAQNGPAMPPTMARNPFPGWKPGTAGLTQSQVLQWTDWYVGALADAARWQATTVISFGFHGYIQVVTPGTGVYARKLAGLAASNLPNGTLGVGAAWSILYAKMVGIPNVVAYVSSVADGSASNVACSPTDGAQALDGPDTVWWSSTRWISRIADQYGFGKTGENPGYPAASNPVGQAAYRNLSSTGLMATTMKMATACGFQGIYWAHDDQLWDGTVTLAALAGYTTPTAITPPAAAVR